MAIQSFNSWLPNMSASNLKDFAKIGAVIGGLAIVGKVLHNIYKRSIADRPYPHIPPNLSQGAKVYLATATPVGGPVTDLAVWPLIRNGFRAATIEVSNREKETYIQESHEEIIGGVSVLVATPKEYQENSKALIYIHGGAWTFGAPDHLCQIFAPIAQQTSLKTYAINYRLAPEHPFPNGLDDCLSVYEELLKTHNPKDIFFLGDSAGANLCIATILKARDKGVALPAAVGVNSPVVDIEKNSDTHYTLAGRDPKLLFEKSLAPSIEVYATNEDPKNPLISVIHADFQKGFPPISIHVGAREILLGDAARLNEKLHNAGQQSSLHVFDGLWHGVQEHGFPESARSMKLMTQFFQSHFD